MSDVGSGNPEREISELLPWYVNQTLSPEEMERVEAYLKISEEARREVAFLRGLRGQIKDMPTSRSPGELGLKRLQRDIARERQDRIVQSYRSGSRWWRPAAIAAALLVAIQAGIIAYDWAPKDTVVTAGGTSGQGVILQVTLVPDATESEIRTLLQSIDGNIISGPGSLGVYRIEIPKNAEDFDGIVEAIDTLRARNEIVTHAQRE